MGVCMKNYKKSKMYGMNMNKKAALLAPLLFYLGAAIFAFTSGVGLGIVFFDDPVSPLSQETIATLQNSFIPQVSEFRVLNSTTYVERFLYPKPIPELQMSVGLLIVSWDDIGNAIEGINFTDVQSGPVNNRSFFVTVAGNSTAVDPLNNTNCRVERNDIGVNISYFCAFSFRVDQFSAGADSPFNEVNILSSSTQHVRKMNVVTIVPRAIPSTLSTEDEIYDFYFDISRTLWTLVLDILGTVWLIIRIVFVLAIIALVLLSLVLLFRWISQT